MGDEWRRNSENSDEDSTCPICSGTGMISYTTPRYAGVEECPACGGTGTVEGGDV